MAIADLDLGCGAVTLILRPAISQMMDAASAEIIQHVVTEGYSR